MGRLVARKAEKGVFSLYCSEILSCQHGEEETY